MTDFIHEQLDKDNGKIITHIVPDYLISSFIGNVCENSEKLMEFIEDNMESLGEGKYLYLMNILRDLRRHIETEERENYIIYPRINTIKEMDHKLEDYSNMLCYYLRNNNDYLGFGIPLVPVKIRIYVKFHLDTFNILNHSELDRLTLTSILHLDTTRKIIGGWKQLVIDTYNGVFSLLIEESSDEYLCFREKLISVFETREDSSILLNHFNRSYDGYWETIKRNIMDVNTFKHPKMAQGTIEQPLNHFTLIKNKKKSNNDIQLYNVKHPQTKNNNYCYFNLNNQDGSTHSYKKSVLKINIDVEVGNV